MRQSAKLLLCLLTGSASAVSGLSAVPARAAAGQIPTGTPLSCSGQLIWRGTSAPIPPGGFESVAGYGTCTRRGNKSFQITFDGGNGPVDGTGGCGGLVGSLPLPVPPTLPDERIALPPAMPSDMGIAIDSATQRWYVNWTGSQVPYVTAGFPSPIVTSPLYRDGLVPPVTSYPVGPPLGTASAVFAPGACLMSPGVIELIARGSFSIRFTTPPPGLA